MSEQLRHLTPTALSRHLGCAHATVLERARAAGKIGAPRGFDASLELLAARGRRHEERYIESLVGEGLEVLDLRDAAEGDVAATLRAIESGVELVVQAPLARDGWRGRADVLLRVDRPAPSRAWSYEVADTKLSQHTKVATVLQLSLYSDWLGVLQDRPPERFHVVMPGTPLRIEPHRTADYAAYVRRAQVRFQEALASDLDEALARSRPEPCGQCEICPWWRACDERWRQEDHLSLVAGATRSQRRELESGQIATLKALATEPERLPERPTVGARESYVRLHHQARIQLAGRDRGEPVHELLEVAAAELGLAELPAPSTEDLFLDFEGDPFVDLGGREYLTGISWVEDGVDKYRAMWGLDLRSERAAFEATVDEILRRYERDPAMHVYHFAPYEPGALKRLVGRHCTRVTELDRILRAELFVDLHRVVRRSLRASVERYSLKDLEPFFGYAREIDLDDAGAARRTIERALELDDPVEIEEAVRDTVEGYNADDCRATRALRDWLEGLRAGVESSLGIVLPRPEAKSGDASPKIAAQDAEIEAVMAELRRDLPEDPSQRSEDDNAKNLLADLLGFHRREERADAWERFRLRDLPEHEREDERAGIAGLEHVKTETLKRSVVHTYRFPPQEVAVRPKDSAYDDAGRARGKVVEIDRTRGIVSLSIGTNRAAELDGHPDWIYVHDRVPTEPKPQALLRFARAMITGTGAGPWRAAEAFLHRRPPQLQGGAFDVLDGESGQQRARRVAGRLERSALPIQGPPGTGKTHTGADMIVDLVRAGRKVGVTGPSHAVIRNLLGMVKEKGDGISVAVKVKERSEDPSPIEESSSYPDLRGRLASGDLQVVGGTTWMWARSEFEQSVDVLFVDEAGQMALADALAVAASAESLVLLGDPQQLPQVRKARHPEGAEESALGHLIGTAPVITPDRGIFLERTWRLPPAICDFTSEMFYAGQLHGLPELERRRLDGTGELGLDGSGLWFVSVPHQGRTVCAPEEVEVIETIIARLLGGSKWTDMDGGAHDLRECEILVIAPYNAQVVALEQWLAAHGVRVGTVDKFQGQQAAVVIFSATSSTGEDAPRGLDFLYSANRFNVATSRAKVTCVVVGSERLFEPDCRDVRHVRLANAFCRFAELAGRCEP